MTANKSQLAEKSTAIADNNNAQEASSSYLHINKPIELSENFYINSKRRNNVQIQVELNEDGIVLRRQDDKATTFAEQLIRTADIIGSRCGPRQKKRTRGGLISCKRISGEGEQEQQKQQTDAADCQKDPSACLYINAYVKQEKPLRRHKTVRILRFRSHERYEDNLKAAERWHSALTHNRQLLAAGLPAKHKKQQQLDGMERKPLLILLNPKSGSGKGREMFHKQVTPIMKDAEMPYDLQVTTHANYARDMLRTRQDLLTRYGGIVVAAGDGLFYEVLNGIMARHDWLHFLQQMPLGIIPCGSGNGLAASIAHLYNEPYEPKPILNASLNCVSGSTTPMDIVRVELSAKNGQQSEMYSFLSVGWGLIADVDIESERLRSIGAPRFTIWSIHRLISLRTYKGKLSYLPWSRQHKEEAAKQFLPKTKSAPAEELEELPPLQSFSPVNEFYDALDDDAVFEDAISFDRSSFRTHLDSWRSASSQLTSYYSIAGQSMRSQRSLNLSIRQKIKLANAELDKQPPPVCSIPPLGMPVPDDSWYQEDGDYVMVHAAYTTHLAADVYFAPESRLNDGIIYLVIIRAGVGRAQLMQFLLNMSSGTHLPAVPNEHIQVVPVSAFRLEPEAEDGILTVDGERVDFGAIQAEIFPGVVHVMVPSTE